MCIAGRPITALAICSVQLLVQRDDSVSALFLKAAGALVCTLGHRMWRDNWRVSVVGREPYPQAHVCWENTCCSHTNALCVCVCVREPAGLVCYLYLRGACKWDILMCVYVHVYVILFRRLPWLVTSVSSVPPKVVSRGLIHRFTTSPSLSPHSLNHSGSRSRHTGPAKLGPFWQTGCRSTGCSGESRCLGSHLFLVSHKIFLLSSPQAVFYTCGESASSILYLCDVKMC